MAGEDRATAFTAGSTAAKKPLKEEEDDELDNVPLSVSRGKKASASKAKELEEDNDELDNTPISRSQAKKGNQKPKSATTSAKASKVKKEENDSDDDFELAVQKKSGGAAASGRTSKVKKLKGDLDDVKDEKKMKKKVSVKGEKTTGKQDKDKVKRERKAFDLPGQKHDPPEERDPLRIFYESLYEQIPSSDMAATWMMEWGLLPLDVARKVFEKKQAQKLKSPVKTTSGKRVPASPIKKTTSSSTKKTDSAAKNAGKTASKKKRKASSDSDNDSDDFMASTAKTKRQKASR